MHNKELRYIDGSFGEGGGQILRTSLALSLVTGTPFGIQSIRAHRKTPGLRQQHLTAVNAAAKIGQAEVNGNFIHSTALTFTPTAIVPGDYHFAVGTAGSCTLVLQTVLPALLLADQPSRLTLEGGTHNPFAPTFDFLVATFLPILTRMGARCSAELERPGYYPAGGGKCRVHIDPPQALSPIDFLIRGAVKKCVATATISKLARHIAERELRVLRREFDWHPNHFIVNEVTNSPGPGNVLHVVIESKHSTEVITGFGQRGVRAEKVASRVVKAVREYLDADVPVGRHLADQLLLPMALTGQGRFRTLRPSQHTLTNIEVIKTFLDIEVTVTQINDKVWELEVTPG